MGSNAQYTKQPSSTDLPVNGTRTVTTAGTRVQLSVTSVPCIDLIIQNPSGAVGKIYIGGVNVASSNGIQLTAGQAMPVDYNNLNKIYLDADNNGQSVVYMYTATVG